MVRRRTPSIQTVSQGGTIGCPPPPRNFFFCFFFVILGLLPQHMEVPRLGIKLELQLPTYATATATQNPSHVCDLHHTSWQRQSLNPLSKANPQPHGS